jgi:hypothetical protein
MALMIPDSIPSKATAGERVLFRTLRDVLPDDYIVYYELEVLGKRLDYLVIAPNRGILVLEVKDYTEKTLYELSPQTWRLHTSEGKIASVDNPILQARGYAFAIVNKLKKDPDLVQQEGKYAGNLKFPYAYATVFTRMKEYQLVKSGIVDVIDSNLILGREDIDQDDDDFSADDFLEKLWSMLGRSFNAELTSDDIDSIRWQLFPEVRLGKKQAKYKEDTLLSLKSVKAMDLYQELLAKQTGDKHRLIRGVAGSGKTLILAARAKVLAVKEPTWRILILCYGVPLSRRLKSMIDIRFTDNSELRDNVVVMTFHEWLRDCVGLHNDSRISSLLDGQLAELGSLPRYDSILIDEYQDFKPEWVRMALACLNPMTESLLLVEDKAQDIYRRKNSLAKDTGLDFRGRSRVLSVNYRNTQQILNFSWKFFMANSSSKDKIKETLSDTIEIIPPRGTKRRGMEPITRRFKSTEDEVDWVVRSIRKLHDASRVRYADIAILYRVKSFRRYGYVETLLNCLKRYNIPFYWLTKDAKSKRDYDETEECVKVSTLDSSKGLDFRVVFMMSMELCPYPIDMDKDREASLVYIGMTRSMEILALTYSGDSDYTRWLEEPAT